MSRPTIIYGIYFSCDFTLCTTIKNIVQDGPLDTLNTNNIY